MRVFLISENKKEKYFCADVLNASDTLIPLYNFKFARMRFLARKSDLRAGRQKNELMSSICPTGKIHRFPAPSLAGLASPLRRPPGPVKRDQVAQTPAA